MPSALSAMGYGVGKVRASILKMELHFLQRVVMPI
jgi:hypothetical protein